MATAALDIRLKRVYDEPASGDGRRVLVDRLWPRGLSRERADIDDWLREIAPSDELRRWFGHEPGLFPEFHRRYSGELRAHRDALADLRRHARAGRLTLVYAARDAEHNNAVVIADALRRGLPR